MGETEKSMSEKLFEIARDISKIIDSGDDNKFEDFYEKYLSNFSSAMDEAIKKGLTHEEFLRIYKFGVVMGVLARGVDVEPTLKTAKEIIEKYPAYFQEGEDTGRAYR